MYIQWHDEQPCKMFGCPSMGKGDVTGAQESGRTQDDHLQNPVTSAGLGKETQPRMMQALSQV